MEEKEPESKISTTSLSLFSAFGDEELPRWWTQGQLVGWGFKAGTQTGPSAGQLLTSPCSALLVWTWCEADGNPDVTAVGHGGEGAQGPPCGGLPAGEGPCSPALGAWTRALATTLPASAQPPGKAPRWGTRC